MSENSTQAEQLKKSEALARLSVVALIQTFGVVIAFCLIKYVPGWLGSTKEEDWQHDCLGIAYFLFGSLGVLLLTFIFTNLFRRITPSFPEAIILLMFVVNTVAFSLAMARTGGPSHSFFGQLVPMQLSGILLLEQQKAAMTSTDAIPPWYFAGFTLLIWLLVAVFPNQVKWLCHWQQMSFETSAKGYEKSAATTLFAVGIIVTAFAYWVTPRPGFISVFRNADK